MGFSLINSCFLISSNSRSFDLIVFENQLCKVSMVNFNSMENSSASKVDFSRARTAVAHLLADKKLFYQSRECAAV